MIEDVDDDIDVGSVTKDDVRVSHALEGRIVQLPYVEVAVLGEGFDDEVDEGVLGGTERAAPQEVAERLDGSFAAQAGDGAQEQAKAFVLLRDSVDVGLGAESEIEEDAFEFVQVGAGDLTATQQFLHD